MKQKTAHQIVHEAIKKYEKSRHKICITDLAKKTGLSYSTLYYPIHKQRQWSADNWLLILEQLGAVEYTSDGILIKQKADQQEMIA